MYEFVYFGGGMYLSVSTLPPAYHHIDQLAFELAVVRTCSVVNAYGLMYMMLLTVYRCVQFSVLFSSVRWNKTIDYTLRKRS